MLLLLTMAAMANPPELVCVPQAPNPGDLWTPAAVYDADAVEPNIVPTPYLDAVFGGWHDVEFFEVPPSFDPEAGWYACSDPLLPSVPPVFVLGFVVIWPDDPGW